MVACPEKGAARAFCVEWALPGPDEETAASSTPELDAPPTGTEARKTVRRTRGRAVTSGRSLATSTTVSRAEHDVRIAIGRTGYVVVVSVQGYLSGDSDGSLEHVLRDLVCEQGNLHVVIDVKGLSGADTKGASVLMEACRVARRCGATLSIRNAPETVRRVLDGCCVDPQVAAMAPAGLHHPPHRPRPLRQGRERSPPDPHQRRDLQRPGRGRGQPHGQEPTGRSHRQVPGVERAPTPELNAGVASEAFPS